MQLPSLEEIQSAATIVAEHVRPTPQYKWPLLCQRCGTEVWVKHENHTAIGSFKIRGGLNYLAKRRPNSIISATRGNHGQSIAYAASKIGAVATIVMPYGNSKEKNAAMRALGAQLIEYGRDFDESLIHATSLGENSGAHFVPSFHRDLVVGVATYGLELFSAVENIDTVYVPIGLGSGICGVISAREALGLSTEIVGVVAEQADAYAQSFEQRQVIETQSSNTFADGIAVRVPNLDSLQIILDNVNRIVRISETEIAAAMRYFFTDTHNIVEGAGASTLAAALKDKQRNENKRIAVIASGGNVDTDVYRKILSGS